MLISFRIMTYSLLIKITCGCRRGRQFVVPDFKVVYGITSLIMAQCLRMLSACLVLASRSWRRPYNPESQMAYQHVTYAASR